jgi:DNA primase
LAFPPQFLEEIRTRLACSEVIGKRVRLIRRGREHVGLCPFHNEKTPSFTVNDDKGFFHCFGCGAHGDVIGFVMRSDNLSFPETVERLAGEAGMPMPVLSHAEREQAVRQQTLHEVVEAACAWFELQLRAPGGRAGLDYLRRRGLDDDTIARFRLGFAPDQRGALKAEMLGKGFKEALLVEAGLLSRPDDGRESFDFFRGRAIFPIMDRRGRPIAFGGRVIGDGEPKYLNSRDTPLFDKGRSLYAHHMARLGVRDGTQVVVAEGYMDVIALHAAGFRGAVAPLGTALTEAQIEALWKLAPEPVLCFDGDAAGQRAALRAAARALPLLKAGHSLRFAVLPPGEDPDSLLRSRGPTAIGEALERARPLVDIVWEAEASRSIVTPEQRAGLEQRLVERIRSIADRSVQSEYFNELIWNRLRKRRRNGAAKGAPSALRSTGDVDQMLIRRAEVLLATLINHPQLIGEEAESLANLELPTPELDGIRQEILNIINSYPDLDAALLDRHLRKTGLAEKLTGILRAGLYELWPFAGPGADLGAARVGWKHMVALVHRGRMEREADAALREFQMAMTPENWARVEGLRQQIQQNEADRADDDEAWPAPAPESGRLPH